MKKNKQLDSRLILDILEKAARPLRLDDILRRVDLSRRLKRKVQDVLHDLAREGELVRMRGGSWVPASSLKTVSGVLAVQRSGAAFVMPASPGKDGGSRSGPSSAGQDIHIAPEAVGDAWNGDLVEVRLLPSRGGRGPEGRVVSVLRRAGNEITVRVTRNRSVPSGRRGLRGTKPASPALPPERIAARPADPRLNFDVLADISGLPDVPGMDELLWVRVDERLESPFDNPLWAATALRSLGREDDARAQETFTKLNHRIPTRFPDDVIEEAEKAARETPQSDPGLEDIRSLPLVTIDGADARDFDDAVFVEKKGKGWRLVVAIADVSLYVRPRTRLDTEARERGNSCYFPTSVEPMLPEALSNGVCSLRPGEDRRVMVADMELGAQGKPTGSRFYAGIMRSRARLTYTGVQAFLDDGEAPVPDFTPELGTMLTNAAALAGLLMERRKTRGGLDFAIPEAEFVVEEGKVKDLRNRKRLFSHRLIEAFMVEANEAVAEFLRRKNAPCLYRVHPAPGQEQMGALLRSLREMDRELPLPAPAGEGREPPAQSWLPGLLRAVENKDYAWLVDTLVLRSMMQARYDPEPDIHFGLASSCYCHFTSPIRRYADLVVHRSLRHTLGLDSGGAVPAGKKLPAVAEICNTRERAAQDAEREITRRMGCLVLQGHEGEEYAGVVSGVIRFGLFVQLESKPLEGMIRVENLGNDYFEFLEDRHELRGSRSGRSFRLGDSLKVRLADVNVGRLEINLALAGEAESDGKRRRAPRTSPKSAGGKKGKTNRGRKTFFGKRR